MANMKMSFNLLVLITLTMAFASPSRRGDRIHFQDSAELGELDADVRPGNQQRNRNYRGRSPVQQNSDNLPQFEQALPGIYPIRGPAQAPLVLPAAQQEQNNVTPIFATQPKVNNPVVVQQQQPPKNYHYAGNPFLSKFTPEPSSTTSTTKFNPSASPGVTNQLPSSDKPLSTTANPRRADLFYGSNLLEEDAQISGNTANTTDLSFLDRGLFDTAPHCKQGQILVNNKCRTEV